MIHTASWPGWEHYTLSHRREPQVLLFRKARPNPRVECLEDTVPAVDDELDSVFRVMGEFPDPPAVLHQQRCLYQASFLISNQPATRLLCSPHVQRQTNHPNVFAAFRASAVSLLNLRLPEAKPACRH